MKPCLVDVNVWIALVVAWHVHHSLATRWYKSLDARAAGICRPVQLGVIRLLGNHSLMGEDVLSATDAWSTLAELMEDERVEFVREPVGIDSLLPTFFRYRVPANKLVGDAYLAAFAVSSARTFVTMDSGFRQFRGLQVELLNA